MKDWKGNSNSVRAAMGISSKGYNYDRAGGDYYATDPAAMRALLEAAQFDWSGHTVWECACGAGNLSKELEKVPGLKVISTDLYDRGYGTAGVDFLKAELPAGVDVIITNPPYKYATEFILHALEILPKAGYCVMLLPITYIAGKERYDKIYKHFSLKSVFVFSGRFHVYKNNDIEASGKSNSMQQYAWFVFSAHRCEFYPEIHWIR